MSFFWADRTAENRRRRYRAFRGTANADVVVIGGGLTGCTAAYALAAAGFKVVLLEADRLASGSTAGSLGAIVPQPDANYSEVERAIGRRAARIAWKEARRSSREFASVLKKLPAKSDLQPVSVVINARSGPDAQMLRREQTLRKDAGLDAPWLGAAAAAAAVGTDTSGAIRLRDAFQYDPVRAALALARAAESNGAGIFERSEVTRTRFTRKDATVFAAGGRIQTRAVFVATGEPGPLFRQLNRHVKRLEGFAVVTESLPAAMRGQVRIGGTVLTEAGEAPHWMRWLSDDRILFAGAAGAPVPSRQLEKAVVQRSAELMYELSVRYPAISGLPAAWGWNLPVVSTSDGLPWIGQHRNYPHHFFALALGWHGDSLGWFAARAAARHFRREPRKEDDVFGFLRHL
jgi:gamma-glutamylputrescine oxidase